MKNLMSLVCAVVLAVSAVAQTEQVVVAGVVKDLRDGRPLAGVSVQVQGAVRRGTPRDPLATGTTGADGHYSISGVDKARARVLFFSAPGYARGMERLPEGSWTDLQTTLAPGADVRGIVVHADTGAPLAKASIEAETARTETDAAGAFVLAGVPLDGEDLSFTVSAEGCVPQEVHISAADLARTDRAALRVPLESGHAAVVAVRDAAGAPIEGAVVRARPLKAVPYSGLERANYSAKTDARGVAVVRGLPRHEAVVLEASYGEALAVQSDTVVAAPDPADGPKTAAATLAIGADRSATVRVVDSAGAPLAGVRLEMLPLVESLQDFAGFVERDNSRGPVQTGTTDAQGVAHFKALPAQPVTVEASLPGHRAALAVLHAESATAEVLIQLAPGPTAPTTVPWFVTIDDAWRAADAKHLPVLFTMSMDGERANDHIAVAHFKDPEVCTTLGALPVVLSNVFGRDGVHANAVKHDEVNGKCTRYGGIPCAAHQATEGYCLDNFGLRGTSFQVPRQIFVTPAGEVLEHRVYYLTERDLQRLTLRSMRRVNPRAAYALAAGRLSGLLAALRSGGAPSRQAAEDVARLAASGDEHAVALCAGLVHAGIATELRLYLLDLLPVEALYAPGSALTPFLHDPDQTIRVRAATKLAAVADDSEVVAVLVAYLQSVDAATRKAAEVALGVRREGDLVLTAQLTPAAQLRVLEALLCDVSVAHLPGLAAVLDSAATPQRARLLRALARHAYKDDEAMALVVARARAADEAVLGAMGFLQPHECSAAAQDALLELGTYLSTSALAQWRLAALRLLLRTDAAHAAARAALHDSDADVNFEAALHLLACGEHTVALLVLDRVDNVCDGQRARGALCVATKAADPGSAKAWRDLLQSQGILEN